MAKSSKDTLKQAAILTKKLEKSVMAATVALEGLKTLKKTTIDKNKVLPGASAGVWGY